MRTVGKKARDNHKVVENGGYKHGKVTNFNNLHKNRLYLSLPSAMCVIMTCIGLFL